MRPRRGFGPEFPMDPAGDIEHLGYRPPPALWRLEGTMAPSVDIEDTGDAYILRAEVPGVSRDNVEVSVTPRSVSLSAHMEESRQVESYQGHFIHRERSQGQFQRTFSLPQEVDPDSARATFRDGLLTVDMPKAENARSRRVDIQPEDEQTR